MNEGTGIGINSLKLDLNDYLNWTSEMVIQWCIQTLQIDENDQLCRNIRVNNITGELLPELSLDDCKELCLIGDNVVEKNSETKQENLVKAVRLKIMINKLKSNSNSGTNEILPQQQQMITKALNNLYSMLESKFQDYQSQYLQLKTEVSDLTKQRSYLQNHNACYIHSNNENGDEGVTHPKVYRSASNIKTYMSSKTMENLTTSSTPVTPSRNMVHSLSRSNLNNNHDQHDNSVKLESIPNQPSPVQSEVIKHLHVSQDDSSEKILKSAMRKHNLENEDWRQYILVMGYGDKERIVESHENPVVIFKSLKEQGLHPTLMLRKRGDFKELQSNEFSVNYNNDITPGGRL